MDTVHWPQEISMKPMEEIIGKNIINSCSKTTSLEKRSRPQKDSAVNCPRCNSTNTKFCYYNNYSLSQPRYFCKTCRRYWTEGGTLRNVPVGGGSRKNKIIRSSSSSYNSSFTTTTTTTSSIISSSNKKLPDLVVPPASTSQNPSRMHHEHAAAGQDLNLGFPSSNDFKTISQLIQLPNFHHHGTNNNNNSNNNNNTTSALQLLSGRGGGMNMINSFMPIPIPVSDSNSVYSSSGELMPDFKIPSLNFSLDGSGIHDQNSSGMLLFPFEDVKTSTISTTTTTTNDHGHLVDEQNRDQNNGDTNGFWSGMLGGGSW
ncbi:hypothetical protein QVD17_04363 [Tagetes erecta]|uniref:Dof zinc finger protein n=1 Tax=Tagetes erecta TaxID=13708 RepID=A0AAD8LA01_TARER|nr:hypothetical protein QVD17_04363 [Tagetes erecta]